MKEINANIIIEPLAKEIKHALMNVESETCQLVKNAIKKESSSLAVWALEQIDQNNTLAKETCSYACQDCGQAVLFVEVGQDVHITNSLENALNSAVELGYKDARKSVADPLTRQNTHTNTPAIIYYNIVEGETLSIVYLAKGAGSENMSQVFMLTPSKGESGIIDSVVKTVVDAGANPCPPLVIGVGIGGTMEKCAILSKKALTRKTGTPSQSSDIKALEDKILKAINQTKIGAQGFGGDTTALAVAVETAPTHIGMLPVAVNIQCHSVRHCKIEF